jgi:hypothetical protein
MELLESIGWIALGFFPTLGCMEIAFRITKQLKQSFARETILREQKVRVPS